MMSKLSMPRARTYKDVLSADELREFMKLQGLTIRELSEILGVSITAISYWLSGERNISPVSARIIRLFRKYPSLLKEF